MPPGLTRARTPAHALPRTPSHCMLRTLLTEARALRVAWHLPNNTAQECITSNATATPPAANQLPLSVGKSTAPIADDAALGGGIVAQALLVMRTFH